MDKLKWKSLPIVLLLLNFIVNGFYSWLFLALLFAFIFNFSKYLLLSDVSIFDNLKLLPFLNVLSSSNGHTLVDDRIFKWIKANGTDENYYCHICDQRRCQKHKKNEKIFLFPEKNVLINSKVNSLFNHCIDMSLLRIESLKNNPKLIKELKAAIAYLTSVLLIKFDEKMQINCFIVNQAFSSLILHLMMFMKGKRKAKSAFFIEDQVLQVYKQEGYFCDESHLYRLIKTGQHLLFCSQIQSHRALSLVSLELITNCIIEPFVDLISSPYYFNTFILLILGEVLSEDNQDKTIPFDNHYLERPKFVYLLQDDDDGDDPNDNVDEKINANKGYNSKNENSFLKVNLNECMKNEQFLFNFIRFLNQEGVGNLIHFLTAIDSLTTKLINPKLNGKEKEMLKHECQSLYQNYFEESSADYIHFKDDQIKVLFQKMLQKESQFLLEHNDSLYKAYDEVYLKLNQIYLPKFIESSFYLKTVVGSQSFYLNLLNEETETCSIKSSKSFSNFQTIQPKVEDWDSNWDSSEDDHEVRDLTSWQVCIEKIEKKSKFYLNDEGDLVKEDEDKLVYLIKVCDLKEEYDWKVQRELDEFYVLQSKLRQFHGNIKGIDCQLPKRRTQLFSSSSSLVYNSCNITYLEERKNDLQSFLESLLFNPFLKSSSLLHSFLKPSAISSNFNSTSVDFKKMIKNFNTTLLLKSGSDLKTSLTPFILNLINSTETRNKSSNELDKDVGDNGHVRLIFDQIEEEIENDLEEEQQQDNQNKKKRYVKEEFESQVKSDNNKLQMYFYDYLLFLMQQMYELNEDNSSNYYILKLFEPMLKKVIQFSLNLMLEQKVKNVLSLENIVYCLEQLKVIIENQDKRLEENEEERLKKKREKDAIDCLQRITCNFPPLSSFFFQVFSCFQYHSLNRQFILMLINQMYQALFPELLN